MCLNLVAFLRFARFVTCCICNAGFVGVRSVGVCNALARAFLIGWRRWNIFILWFIGPDISVVCFASHLTHQVVCFSQWLRRSEEVDAGRKVHRFLVCVAAHHHTKQCAFATSICSCQGIHTTLQFNVVSPNSSRTSCVVKVAEDHCFVFNWIDMAWQQYTILASCPNVVEFVELVVLGSHSSKFCLSPAAGKEHVNRVLDSSRKDKCISRRDLPDCKQVRQCTVDQRPKHKVSLHKGKEHFRSREKIRDDLTRLNLNSQALPPALRERSRTLATPLQQLGILHIECFHFPPNRT
mmetsp:Transcript_17119/g.46971  ORF Transcript_17119/g.46971 Transcript_17119/m.46971 type:complete len:295 (+) Transcript_17119:669-1553(+)